MVRFIYYSFIIFTYYLLFTNNTLVVFFGLESTNLLCVHDSFITLNALVHSPISRLREYLISTHRHQHHRCHRHHPCLPNISALVPDTFGLHISCLAFYRTYTISLRQWAVVYNIITAALLLTILCIWVIHLFLFFLYFDI